MTNWQHWQIEETAADLVTVWIDVQNKSQNIFSAEVLTELEQVLSELESRQQLSTILFRSRKSNSFFAGANVSEFQSVETTEEARMISQRGQDLFARVAALQPTTIAVIQGACLGGGLEFALACDFRIAVIDSSTRLGLPETQLGILPGWGGTQRLPKVVGLMQALALILRAKKLTAEKAEKQGLVDRAVTSAGLETLLTEAKTWDAADRPKRQRTWIGWFLEETSFGRSLVINATKKRIGRDIQHYPALEKATEAIALSFQNGQVGYDYEQAAIATLMFTPTCQSLVSIFLNRERARDMSTWNVPEAIQHQKIESLGVLGGGTMGAGIAQAGIKKGLRVVLKEINDEAIDAARQRIDKTYQTLLSRKSITAGEAEQEKALLTYTTSTDPMQELDVIVEAVPESLELKQKLFTELASSCTEATVLATNTSSLSVDEIFASVEAKYRTGGLHFFNPVHRMDLVEVIAASDSSEETVGKLLLLAKQLGKTPIVSRDSPGFVVNRVLMPYLDEAVMLAIERSAQQSDLTEIDRCMKRFGMPMGPLELIDQVGVDVAAHVAGTMSIVFGKDSVTGRVLQRMVDAKRLGKKAGLGFYRYEDGKKKDLEPLTPLLSDIEVDLLEPPTTALNEELSAMQQRLVLAMVNEAGRCLDENIVAEAWMIDLAMVLGTGFAPFRGGPLRYARQFSSHDLVSTLEAMARVYGPRFEPAEAIQHLDQY